MKKVLLVGAGQLGSRHLQSLAELDKNFSLAVVDPSLDSLSLATARYEEVQSVTSPKNITFSPSLRSISGEFDYCIVATGAKNRLEVIRNIIEHCTVANFIFEKVLFQSADIVEQAQSELAPFSDAIWVNCPRRLFPIYQLIKQRISSSQSVKLLVDGSDWGLACNSIHFIDLWSYLTGVSSYHCDLSKLEPSIEASKREGYFEVYGLVKGSSDNHSFELNCSNSVVNPKPVTVRIVTERETILVKESEGVCEFYSGNDEVETLPFDFIYQSNLTSKVIMGIEDTNDCGLTPFSDSCELHKPFLTNLLAHFNKVDNSNRYFECQIT